MRFKFDHSTLHRFRRFLVSVRGRSLICGGMAGFYILSLCHQFVANFGTSLPVVTAVGLALALGVHLGCRQTQIGRASKPQTAVRFGLTHFGLSVWMVAFGWLIQLVLSGFRNIPSDTLAVPAVGLGFYSGAAVLLLGIPFFWIARLPVILFRRSQQWRRTQVAGRSITTPLQTIVRCYLSGIMLGLLFDVLILAPVAGVQTGGLTAALAGGVAFLICIGRRESATAPKARDFREGEAPAEPPTHDVHEERLGGSLTLPSQSAVRWQRMLFTSANVWTILVVGCLGALFALLSRSIHQLMPVAGYLIWVEWVWLLGGLALGLWLAERLPTRGVDQSSFQAWSCLLVAACALGWLAVHPWLVETMLLMNSHISQVWLSMSVRGIVAGIALIPIGFGWGSVLSSNPHKSGLLQLHPLSLAGGFFLIRWIGLPNWGVGELFVAVAWLLFALALSRWLPVRRVPRAWGARGAVAAALGLIVAAPQLCGKYDPARSARLLFWTNVFVAKRNGLDSSSLPVLDEGRNIAVFEGERGTYTVWKHRSVQFQVRESGVPKAIVSTNPDICPQYSAESMQAVLPLVLHEGPHRVLLLGMGCGVPLTTCLSFPVQEITCVESDPGLLDLLKTVIWPESEIEPLADDRVRLLRMDPALAVACQDQAYDVIVSSPDQSALLQATPYSTLEFYQRAASCLADGGIFCQRFQRIDFGPQPIQVVVRTIQAAFRHVDAVETASGELVLLATNSTQGLHRDGFVERLQRPHVRKALSEIGWDWSVLLTLTVYRHELLAEFAEENSPGINTAANGKFAYRLPQEVMRWAPKWREAQTRLSKYRGSFLKGDGVDGNDPDLLRRLAELAGQQRLVARFPDQWFGYRDELRDQMKKPKHSVIQPVKGGPPRRKLHPDDKRRKNYFKALSFAAEEHPPAPQAIRRLAAYATPYDPLMSYFVHYEVAHLYSRTQPRDVQAELAHRLHLAYYADARDRSVRNIASALTLLVEHPSAAPEPIERFDHINALLQVLKIRWGIPGPAKPKNPRTTLNDIKKSVAALEISFEAMDKLTHELGLPETGWPARRQYLEKGLIRPLRTYRSRLLPHHRRQLRKKKEIFEPKADD